VGLREILWSAEFKKKSRLDVIARVKGERRSFDSLRCGRLRMPSIS